MNPEVEPIIHPLNCYTSMVHPREAYDTEAQFDAGHHEPTREA